MRSSRIILIMLILSLALAAIPVSAFTLNSNLGSQVDVPYNQNTSRRVTISNNEGGPVYMLATKTGFSHNNLVNFSGIYSTKVVEISDGSTKNCDITFMPYQSDITKKENVSISFKKATLTQTTFLCTGDGTRTEYIFSSLPVLDGGATISFDPANVGTYQYSFNYDIPKVVFTPAIAPGDKATVTYKYASATSDDQTMNFTLSYTGKYSNVYTRKFTKDKTMQASPYSFKLVTVGTYTQVEINDNSLSPQMYPNPDAESFYQIVISDQIAMACTGIAGNDAYFTIFSAFPITWGGSTSDPEEDPMDGDVSDMVDWWNNNVFGGTSDRWWSIEKWWGDANPPTNLSDYIDTNLIHKTYLTTNYYDRTTIDNKLQQYTPSGGSSGGVVGINDGTTSTSQTWSSSKIATQFNQFDTKFNGYVTRDEFNSKFTGLPSGTGNVSTIQILTTLDGHDKRLNSLTAQINKGTSFFGTGIPQDWMIVISLFVGVFAFILGRTSSSKAFSPEFQRQKAMIEQDRERVGYSSPSKPSSRFSFGRKPTPTSVSLRPQQPQVKPKQQIDLTERPDIEKKIQQMLSELISQELSGKAKAED